jgi:hypothetical protein
VRTLCVLPDYVERASCFASFAFLVFAPARVLRFCPSCQTQTKNEPIPPSGSDC